jgi:hypothetical protein
MMRSQKSFLTPSLHGDGLKNHFSPRRRMATTSEIIFHPVAARRRLQKSFFIPSPHGDDLRNRFSSRRRMATTSEIVFHPVAARRRLQKSFFAQPAGFIILRNGV